MGGEDTRAFLECRIEFSRKPTLLCFRFSKNEIFIFSLFVCVNGRNPIGGSHVKLSIVDRVHLKWPRQMNSQIINVLCPVVFRLSENPKIKTKMKTLLYLLNEYLRLFNKGGFWSSLPPLVRDISAIDSTLENLF